MTVWGCNHDHAPVQGGRAPGAGLRGPGASAMRAATGTASDHMERSMPVTVSARSGTRAGRHWRRKCALSRHDHHYGHRRPLVTMNLGWHPGEAESCPPEPRNDVSYTS